ncbi:glycosyltransferase [Rosettibacter firmus]|uniref:glycosyltransferase n=1 Tax=Rosettibacter firmus TaxID=3111522 RepID=UPI00336BF627
MSKTNIVVFIPTLTSGGAEKQAVILSKVLMNKYSPYVVVWDKRKVEMKFKKYLDDNKIQYYFLSGNIIKRFLKLYLFLKRKKIEIIFNFLASNNLYSSIIGKLARVPHIVGGIRNSKVPFLKFIIQKYLHNHLLEFTIFNNYTGCKYFVDKGFEASKCIVIPNCFEQEIEYIERVPKKTIKIVTLARFVPQKDYYTALKSIQHLIKNYNLNENEIRYRIIGYGEQELQIYRWINELQLKKVVEVFIKPDNVFDLLKECDIFLMTSLFEGTSNSIMEAMALSLPIVATDVGDNKFLVEDNKNGFLSPIKDYTNISANLFRLIVDSNLRLTFGLNSYNRLYQNYSLKAFREKYFYFIDKILNVS